MNTSSFSLSSSRQQLARFAGWFCFANAVIFWLIGSSYLRILFSSNTLFIITFSHNLPLPGKIWVCIFAIITWLGYLAFLAFIPLVLVILPLILIIPHKKIISLASIIIATCSVTALLIDSRIFALYRFHLSKPIIEMIFSKHLRMIFELSSYEMLSAAAIILMIFIIEYLLARFIWQRIIQKRSRLHGKKIAVFLSLCLLFSWMTVTLATVSGSYAFPQQTANWPLYDYFLAKMLPGKNTLDIVQRASEAHFAQPEFATGKLNYPLHPLICSPPKKPYNIVIIGLDSWRFDAMNAEVTPNIYHFAKNTWQFRQHFSGGNSTQPGLFSLFFSMPPNYWSSVLKQKQESVFLQELAKNNYQMRVFFSSEMQYPPLDKTIFRGIANLRENQAPGKTVGDHDRAITQEFMQFIKQRKTSQPFFSFIFYDAPHGYCTPQNFAKPWQPAVAHCNRLLLNNQSDPKPYLNRYLNAVQFDDGLIGEIITQLKQHDLLQNTIVIITSDHGQEFNDTHNNYWEHASNFTRYQTQVPLIIYWPKEKPEVVNYRTSHYDIVPTLLNKLFNCHNSIKDYSIGLGLLNSQPRNYLPVGSYTHFGILTEKNIIEMYASGNVVTEDANANEINSHIDYKNVNRVLYSMKQFFQK